MTTLIPSGQEFFVAKHPKKLPVAGSFGITMADTDFLTYKYKEENNE